MDEKNNLKIERRFDKLETDVDEWKADLEELKAGLSIIIKKMNDYQEENRRHFQVLMEHYSSEIRTVGEGIRANRDRLDDHESRILKLEAS